MFLFHNGVPKDRRHYLLIETYSSIRRCLFKICRIFSSVEYLSVLLDTAIPKHKGTFLRYRTFLFNLTHSFKKQRTLPLVPFPKFRLNLILSNQNICDLIFGIKEFSSTWRSLSLRYRALLFVTYMLFAFILLFQVNKNLITCIIHYVQMFKSSIDIFSNFLCILNNINLWRITYISLLFCAHLFIGQVSSYT